VLHQPLPIDRLCALVREGVDWDGLFAACRRHGLLPLVNRALRQLPGELCPEPHRERFRVAAAAVTLRSLQLHTELRRLLVLLDDARIPAIPFKGPILAEQAYGDAGIRDFVDLDLLVPQLQVAAAIAVLAEAGYRQPAACGRRDWQTLLSTTNEIALQHASQPWLVEVHWDFAKPWFCLNFPLETLWADGERGVHQPRLDAINTLLQLCIHGTSHYWDKLKWVVDVERFVRSTPELDWHRLWLRAEQARCTRALLLGLALAHSHLGLSLPVAVTQRLAACRWLAWPSRFVRRGWLASGEKKRSLSGRVLFILCCRETSSERLLAVWRGLTCRRAG
jgi:hypothetical protein